MSELRDRHRALSQQAIVDATAALVTERKHLDFSMKEVAERAGVSLRTVYNHFPDRQDLLDALGRSFDERARALGQPNAENLAGGLDIASAIRASNTVFDQLGGTSEAFAQLPLADVGRDPTRAARTQQMVDHLVTLMPTTPDDVAVPIALVLRHLLSHRSWFWLTREYGLETDQVSDLVIWAIDTLTAAAESGSRPGAPEET
jgi:AcrR family transcriptional regulator